MSKYQLHIDDDQTSTVNEKALSLGMSIEEYIAYIVNNHLNALHSIKEADYQRAYLDSSFTSISDI